MTRVVRPQHPAGVWNDMQGNAAGYSNKNLFDNYRGAAELEFPMATYDADTSVVLTYQFSHAYDGTTPVRPHLHYIPMSAADGNVLLRARYIWMYPGSGEIPAPASWTLLGDTLVAVASAEVYTTRIVSLGQVPAVGDHTSAGLGLQLTRLGTDPTDTYNTAKDHGTKVKNNFALLFLDVHYLSEAPGSWQEYTS